MRQEVRSSKRHGKNLTLDRLSGAFLIVLGLFVTWERRVLPLGTAQHPGPGYFPLVLAILLVVFGAILILRGKHSPLFRSVSWSEAPHAVPILGGCILVALFMEQIGYRLTMFIVLGVLFGVIERIRIGWTLTLCVCLSLGSFWLFDTLLRVPLPRGWWGF
jgi:putative tricarboxylic transport membrane protein